MATKTAIVTGATGFVGANLAQRLLQDGHEVHLLLRHGYAPWRIAAIRSAVQRHEVDLGDSQELERVVAAIRPDWVFHLAVHGAYSSQGDLHQMVATNIVGTINLVQAAQRAGVAAFVNTGSSSEYGFKDHAPPEDTWLEPNSDYAVTKAAATLYCRHAARRGGLLLPTLRLYSVYGPYEEPARLLPSIVVHGLRGALPPLVSPDIARDYVYIDDVIDAYLLAATAPNQVPGAVYNVGTGSQTSLGDVVSTARRVLAVAAEPRWGSMPNRGWDTNVWVANNREARRALGWRPQHTFEDGLRRHIRWFQEHPDLLRHYEDSLGIVETAR